MGKNVDPGSGMRKYSGSGINIPDADLLSPLKSLSIFSGHSGVEAEKAPDGGAFSSPLV